MNRDDVIRLFKEHAEPTATTVIPTTGEVLLGKHEIRAEQLPKRKFRSAGVLIALVNHPEGLNVIFTRRRDDLAHHAGQVSFPGGMAEPGDANLKDTALREAQEEIGLDPKKVEILGRLGDYVTKGGVKIAPYVGLVEPPIEVAPCPNEVAEIFEVPLEFLIDKNNHSLEVRDNSVNLRNWSMTHGTQRIWGVTAQMVVGFGELLATL
jgi:8-oxo-dGTP pyrophosphatase MutT (NUDIX family)